MEEIAAVVLAVGSGLICLYIVWKEMRQEGTSKVEEAYDEDVEDLPYP